MNVVCREILMKFKMQSTDLNRTIEIFMSTMSEQFDNNRIIIGQVVFLLQNLTKRFENILC
jgi:hypothetical protein